MEEYATIPLSGEKGKGRVAKVDRYFLKTLQTEKWYLNSGGYAVSSSKCLMHRKIAELRGEKIKDLIVDHVNGDRLDNRSANLRVVTTKQNNKNKHRDPTHEGLVGVKKKDTHVVREGTIKVKSVATTFVAVHKNIEFFEHSDPRICALCYDSVIFYCYGYGKRLNDNRSKSPLPLTFWIGIKKEVLEDLERIKNSYTDYKGVKKVKDGWCAKVTINLGTFGTKEEAAVAYDRAVRHFNPSCTANDVNFT
jgi:hypothetical protein